MRLDATKAVVTGAGGGLGRWFCKRLCESGATVVATDRDEGGLAKTMAEVSKASPPGKMHVHTADVTSEDQVGELFEKAREAMGGCNVLVNNAGLLRDSMLIKKDKASGKGAKNATLKDWHSVIDVNLTGAFLCTREFAAGVVGNEDKGVVVNMSSAARHGGISQGNYSASKAGLAATTNVWGRELARHNIRVGAVAPGAVETEMLQGLAPDMMEKLQALIPLRRLATPEEVWMGVKFIIECDYFTAQILDLDGGLRL
eukprot:CAMPEP_0173432450 /NCGR_PEP_ID=MMETSP1357-20121228/10243_1 /TAXON_ID=77926 /ORGANISM="Hemiselmis rufescens, Strain PCC563" /LENGTH=257 /DNA_ID=CAMNT_0014397043 /DNA_START=84 /DNA_END=857 /DNA_ORIENTATION=+